VIRLGAQPDADRRRSPRYALDGATVRLRGHTLPILDISVLGARARGGGEGLAPGAVLTAELRLPRAAAAAPPRRFSLVASIADADSRGVVLRWLQPSPRWARVLSTYLRTVARAG
jgi:hypothetical protein